MIRSFALCAVLAILTLAAPARATDQTRPMVDMLVANTNGDLDGFLDRMKRVETIAARLGLPATIRVFQATFAGPRTGEVYIYWELPSFVAFAEAETKLHADPEFLALVEDMGAAGQSFQSELLAIEITRP